MNKFKLRFVIEFIFTGAFGGILRETARCINGEKVNLTSVAGSVGYGIIFGSCIAVPTQVYSYLQQHAIDMSKIDNARISIENEVAMLRSEIEATKLKTREIEVAAKKNSNAYWILAFIAWEILQFAL